MAHTEARGTKRRQSTRLRNLDTRLSSGARSRGDERQRTGGHPTAKLYSSRKDYSLHASGIHFRTGTEMQRSFCHCQRLIASQLKKCRIKIGFHQTYVRPRVFCSASLLQPSLVNNVLLFLQLADDPSLDFSDINDITNGSTVPAWCSHRCLQQRFSGGSTADINNMISGGSTACRTTT